MHHVDWEQREGKQELILDKIKSVRHNGQHPDHCKPIMNKSSLDV